MGIDRPEAEPCSCHQELYQLLSVRAEFETRHVRAPEIRSCELGKFETPIFVARKSAFWLYLSSE